MDKNNRLRMKFKIKELCKGVMIILLAPFRYLNCKKDKRILILAYHRINNKTGDNCTVKTDEFERQVQYLLHNYNIVGLKDIVDYLQGKVNLADNCLAITFDDGYEELYLSAYPIFKKYNLPVTIFLVTDYIGTDKEFYWDRRFGLEDNKFLSWLQVKNMSENNISFGIHTATHPNLARLNKEEARKEICESKRKLEGMLNKKTDFFAYPFGTILYFNDVTKKIISECGFGCALTTIYGTINLNSDIFCLRRIVIDGSDNFSIFKAKVGGDLDILSLSGTRFWQVLFLQFNRFLSLNI